MDFILSGDIPTWVYWAAIAVTILIPVGKYFLSLDKTQKIIQSNKTLQMINDIVDVVVPSVEAWAKGQIADKKKKPTSGEKIEKAIEMVKESISKKGIDKNMISDVLISSAIEAAVNKFGFPSIKSSRSSSSSKK